MASGGTQPYQFTITPTDSDSTQHEYSLLKNYDFTDDIILNCDFC